MKADYSSGGRKSAPAAAGLPTSFMKEDPVSHVAIDFLPPNEVPPTDCKPLITHRVAVGVEGGDVGGLHSF